MNKLFLALISFLLVFAFIACAPRTDEGFMPPINTDTGLISQQSEIGSAESTPEAQPSPEEDIVYQQETAPAPDWVPKNVEGGTPWMQDLTIASSADGFDFKNARLFIPHAGVGHLLLTRNDQLIATFQYFSYTNQSLFDRIAYTISHDFGQTWSPVRPVLIDVPTPGPTPVDPTLIQLDDGSFRLYFTYHQHGDLYPQLFSAKANAIDSVFQWEGKQLSSEQVTLDPAIVFYNGIWHHFTTTHGGPANGNLTNIHSTASDGLQFERQKDISIGMGFLGDVIAVEGGLRFYGDRSTAFSADGFNWEMEMENTGLGGDPGVVALPDGIYLAIYTSFEG